MSIGKAVGPDNIPLFWVLSFYGDVHVVDDHVVGVVDATEKGEVHDQGGLVMVLFFMWRLNIIWQMRM